MRHTHQLVITDKSDKLIAYRWLSTRYRPIDLIDVINDKLPLTVASGLVRGLRRIMKDFESAKIEKLDKATFGHTHEYTVLIK